MARLESVNRSHPEPRSRRSHQRDGSAAPGEMSVKRNARSQEAGGGREARGSLLQATPRTIRWRSWRGEVVFVVSAELLGL